MTIYQDIGGSYIFSMITNLLILIHQILVLKINSTKIKTKYLNADAVQNRWMKTMMLLEATSGIEMEI